MPSLLEQIAAAKRRKNRSAPQNAVLSHAAQGFQTQDFKTTSPQGDGNKFETYLEDLGYEIISKPHPRKGTETRIAQQQMESLGPISKPHPRKGTETRINLLL